MPTRRGVWQYARSARGTPTSRDTGRFGFRRAAGTTNRMIRATEATLRVRSNRQTLRLPGYDYASPGAYFVTVSTHMRGRALGRVTRANAVRLTQLGGIVTDEWRRSALIRSEITSDAFVVMPDHVHGIVWITDSTPNGADEPGDVSGIVSGTNRPQSPSRTLGAMVRSFKAAVTRRARRQRLSGPGPLWQRNFYERVIRDERELAAARQYIRDNPTAWNLVRAGAP